MGHLKRQMLESIWHIKIKRIKLGELNKGANMDILKYLFGEIKKYKNILYTVIIFFVFMIALEGWNNYWNAKKEIEIQKIAYKNQIEDLMKKINILDKSKIKEIKTEKYKEGKIVEIKTEKEIEKNVDAKTDETTKTNVVFKEEKKYKLWFIGADYNFYSHVIYLKGGLLVMNTLGIEFGLPINSEILKLRTGLILIF